MAAGEKNENWECEEKNEKEGEKGEEKVKKDFKKKL